MWNFGSLLGLSLAVQILSGFLLATHYASDTSLAFDRIDRIIREVGYGWIARVVHANGARIFFALLYLHVGRGLYFRSFRMSRTWRVGVVLLIAVMATAFMGYVLPWGQMSFWGATVITNLFSAIPALGEEIVTWLWGGFSVDNPTLTRFFALHFILPFVVRGLVIVHLIFLHETGSRNPLGVRRNKDKVPFYPYFFVKDFLGVRIALLVLIVICSMLPWSLGDPENFSPANSLVTPVHIQPEWYFLFAYAILRSIPRKLGGVVALGASVAILFLVPLIPKRKFSSLGLYPLSARLFWIFISIMLLLTWIGARPVEEPYVLTGQILTVLYFSYFPLERLAKAGWDKALETC